MYKFFFDSQDRHMQSEGKTMSKEKWCEVAMYHKWFMREHGGGAKVGENVSQNLSVETRKTGEPLLFHLYFSEMEKGLKNGNVDSD